MADRLQDFYDVVGSSTSSPWTKGGKFKADLGLLTKLVQVAVDTGRAKNAQRGGAAPALDVWIASELRRAGITDDAVWPRATEPRTLPQPLAAAVAGFKFRQAKADREIQEKTLARLVSTVGQSRTNVVGGQFVKEIDIAVADHDRGLELAVSTKAMRDSYAKNITNRWEEASGDLLNIRRRFPLATFGFALIVTEPVLSEKNSWARLKDMCRKLSTVYPGTEGSAYDAAMLVVADWSTGKAKLSPKEVPDDLGPSAFFERMLPTLFERSPVVFHPEARSIWNASDPPKDLD